jgi:hypothetical protein
MMIEWSLSNFLLPISYRQFVDLTTQFKKAAEHSCGAECKLQFCVLNIPKKYTEYKEADIQRNAAGTNKAYTFFKPGEMIGRNLWKKAAYVAVFVIPPADSKAYVIGSVEFKGCRPKQATFCILSDDEGAKREILMQNRGKRVGDGVLSNYISPADLFGPR